MKINTVNLFYTNSREANYAKNSSNNKIKMSTSNNNLINKVSFKSFRNVFEDVYKNVPHSETEKKIAFTNLLKIALKETNFDVHIPKLLQDSLRVDKHFSYIIEKLRFLDKVTPLITAKNKLVMSYGENDYDHKPYIRLHNPEVSHERYIDFKYDTFNQTSVTVHDDLEIEELQKQHRDRAKKEAEDNKKLNNSIIEALSSPDIDFYW